MHCISTIIASLIFHGTRCSCKDAQPARQLLDGWMALVCTCVCGFIHMFIYVCMIVYMFVYLYVYLYVYVCMYICIPAKKLN